MEPEHVLCQIDPDYINCHLRTLLVSVSMVEATIVAPFGPLIERGSGPSHQIRSAPPGRAGTTAILSRDHRAARALKPERTGRRFIEFFIATIRNRNTRMACARRKARGRAAGSAGPRGMRPGTQRRESE